MGLSEDQKAMLRLLAQREQGYGDIAALTGQGVEDVRAKVKDAIAALDGSATPADDQKAMLRLLAQREEGYGDIAALTGQGVEDVRAKVGVALSALGGSAESPPPAAPEPAPAPTPPAKPKPKKATPTGRSKPKLPDDRGAVWGLGAGLVVVLIIVILLATGALGGDDGDSDSGGGSGGGGDASKALKPTQAVLEAVDGGDASGRALFGKDGKQVVLLVQASGLEPSPQGRSYTVSLTKSPSERLPLVATRVPSSGKIESSFKIASQVLGLLASGFDTMEISLVSNGELGAALKAARTAKNAPQYNGVDVLRGAVTGSIVEAGEQGEVRP